MWRSAVGFIVTLTVTFLVAPLIAGAQQTGKVPHIVVLQGIPKELTAPEDKAFEDKLGELGYVNGRNIRMEHRPATEATSAGMSKAAMEVVALKPDLIVVWRTLGAFAVKKATSTIPVVFLSVGFPVETGLVASLRRSGGNLTGVAYEASVETNAKRIQLLKEVVPTLRRAALLYALGDPYAEVAIEAVRAAAPSLGIKVKFVGVRDASELDAAFATIARGGAQGVLVVGGLLTFAHRQKIADLALRHRLPSISPNRETVAVGGLMSLGANQMEIARMGAFYVDKILKGANPADLPVEQPNRYDLHINLKTAKALGLTFPQSINFRADEVIE